MPDLIWVSPVNLQFEVGAAAEAGGTFRSDKESANIIALIGLLIWI